MVWLIMLRRGQKPSEVGLAIAKAQRLRTSVVSARVAFGRTSRRGRSSGRRSSVGRRMSVDFVSGVGASVVWRGPEVRSLEVIGRPGLVARLEPRDFEQPFFDRSEGVLMFRGDRYHFL